ncbi:MAG: serine protease [Chloroflexi bacterium]|nr:serine protease [Chloroflexota bacterium]
MSAQNELRQAIELMQDGQAVPAVDLLNRLVESAELDGKGRAAAYVWLAESREDSGFKIRCLERALEQDPDNRQIRQGLQQLIAARAQPSQLPAMGAERNRVELREAPPVIGIVGGLNGMASGVFVDGRGLIATTSYAIGSIERVTVTLDAQRRLAGEVVRRLPTHDLALVDAPLRIARVTAAAPASMIVENTAFIALGYGGARLRGALAQFNSRRARQWLRTTIPPVQMPDAGGNPLYDDNGQLLGLLTRNVDGAGNTLALNMSQVLALTSQWKRDRRLMPDACYCVACGSLTRAPLFGGSHCETCGAAQPIDNAFPRQIDKLAALYGAGDGAPCPHCDAQVGAYNDRCLRCGHKMARGESARN